MPAERNGREQRRQRTASQHAPDLSNDRRHQCKVSGVWYSPWKLSLGAAAYYRTGTPVTRYGYSDIYGRYEFFLAAQPLNLTRAVASPINPVAVK